MLRYALFLVYEFLKKKQPKYAVNGKMVTDLDYEYNGNPDETS
jgi:hypothetical protein